MPRQNTSQRNRQVFLDIDVKLDSPRIFFLKTISLLIVLLLTNVGLYAYGENHSNAIQPPPKTRNIILMIGDGMGVAQVSAGLTANQGNLFLCNFLYL